MIPKVIHYCWFGRNPKPDLALKCMKSWKKYCPDYEIIEWNEDNFDISACPLYVRQAYAEKRWAFVTDYVRLKVVYDHGGIYLDTDVELRKPLTPLLDCHAYFGFEEGHRVNTGLGFGAEAGVPILRELIADYQEIPFIKEDGSYDLEPCPSRNTKIFLRHGLRLEDSMQVLEGNIRILPTIYLCPLSYSTKKRQHSSLTISIHWFTASWKSEEEKARHKQKLRRERIDYILHIPNRLMMKLLGQQRYQKLKHMLKKGN